MCCSEGGDGEHLLDHESQELIILSSSYPIEKLLYCFDFCCSKLNMDFYGINYKCDRAHY